MVPAMVPALVPTLVAMAALIALSGLVGGCGEPDSSADKGRVADAPAEGPVRIDTSGWRAFRDLGDRIVAGETFTRQELDEIKEQEAFQRWLGCLGPGSAKSARIGLRLEGAFWSELGNSGQPRFLPQDGPQARNYQYSYRSRDTVERQLAQWEAQDQQQKLLSLMNVWIAPEDIPDPLVIHFLPTGPELRYCAGEFFVDTGLLAAGGNRQLTGQLVSRLYRAAYSRAAPGTAAGAGLDAIAATLQKLMHQGVANWIENGAYTHFKADHYYLSRYEVIPEDFFNNGVRTIEFLNASLPELLADPIARKKSGPTFERDAAAGGSLVQSGYAMAATIAHRLGEKKLVAVRESAAAFLAAYQEAALRNSTDAVDAETAATSPSDVMIPLDPDVFRQLLALVEAEQAG